MTLSVNAINPNRLDALIIWGHGLKYRSDILAAIEDHPDFRIKKVYRHKPEKISDLVDEVYSFDYAPIQHLRGKVRYLLTTPNEAFFVFFENLKPDIEYLGEGAYRHEESITLKKFKEELRDQFNPRLDGKRTEHHVVHATDNPLQTDKLLRYLRVQNGIADITQTDKVFQIPHHLRREAAYRLRYVPIRELVCNTVIADTKGGYIARRVPLVETPQVRTLTGGWEIYQKYLDQYLGDPLTDYYSIKKYKALAESTWQYLAAPFENDYVIVSRREGQWVVQDGVHRASILAARGVTSLLVLEIELWDSGYVTSRRAPSA